MLTLSSRRPRYGQFRVEAAGGGPLGERVAGRLSALYNTYDDILDNKYPEQLNGPPVAGQGAGRME